MRPQDELAAALEALGSKRRRAVDLEAQAVEARVAAGKKRYDLVSAKLASADASEQMAAFDATISSEDENLRRLAFTAAFRSGNDDLQGAALSAYIAGMPQMSISVNFNLDGDTGHMFRPCASRKSPELLSPGRFRLLANAASARDTGRFRAILFPLTPSGGKMTRGSVPGAAGSTNRAF